MNFYYPIFGLFVIFTIWQAYERKKSDKVSRKSSDDFWQRESDANTVRKKPLDNEDYIIIPDEIFVESLVPDYKKINDDDAVKELDSINNTLASLKDKRILNLTGLTATDIKEMYGVANLNIVSEYDDNYTLLVKNIARYGELLLSLNYQTEATKVLEFGIDSLTDITTNYKLLVGLYIENGQADKIEHLTEVANSLNSLNKNVILDILKASSISK